MKRWGISRFGLGFRAAEFLIRWSAGSYGCFWYCFLHQSCFFFPLRAGGLQVGGFGARDVTKGSGSL
jgi:hypothetical protein